jgi:hypothetical protein
MTRNASVRFHTRAFVTLFVTLSFFLLSASGVVLYVAPPGRVASWSHWTALALDRPAWQSLHTALALCFVLAGAFHVWFNWRSLWHHVRSRLGEGVRVRRELAAATAALAAVAALTVADLPPFAAVADLGERARESWATPESEPPVPHAELLTLERLAATTALPIEQALANLASAGVDGGRPQTTLAALATANGLTPQQVWLTFRGRATPKTIPAAGGYGTKTVAEVCAQLEIPLAEGLARLRAQGIEASQTSSMRLLAEAHGRRAHDLVRILAGA